jgi:hypothetical protein
VSFANVLISSGSAHIRDQGPDPTKKQGQVLKKEDAEVFLKIEP